MPQTYLPFGQFKTCALVLDDARLGNQRVDNIRILQSLSGHRVVTSSKWHDPMTGKVHTDHYPRDHWYVEKHLTGDYPVNKFWVGYEWLFKQYHQAVCDEYRRRDFTDTCWDKFIFLWDHCYSGTDDDVPDWYGNTDFHNYMQALLVEKAPKVYAAKFPGLLEGWDYKWKNLTASTPAGS